MGKPGSATSLILILLAWLVSAGVVHWVGYDQIFSEPLLIALTCGALTLLIAAVALDRSNALRATEVESYLRRRTYEADDIGFLLRHIVYEKARPLVRGERDPDKLAETAAKLIRDAHKAKSILGFQVVFFGAAALQSPPDEDWRHDADADQGLSPHQIYHGALEEIASKGIAIARFVGLLDPAEFKNRSSSIRKRYLHWLTAQRSQMKRNPNFVLVDSPRAPKWGASGGGILSGNLMIQFTHRKGFAFLIEDDRLSTIIAEPTIDEITSGKKENMHAYIKSREYSEKSQRYDYEDIATFDALIQGFRNMNKSL